MKKERVFITVTNDLSYDQRMIKTATTLCEMGYDIVMVGRVRKKSIPIANQCFEQKRLSCFFDKGALFYTEFNLRLFWFLLFQSFDRVIAVDLDTIIPCYFAGKLKNAQLYYDAHEYFPEVPELVNRPRIQKIWLGIERIFVPKFQYFYTVSQGVANIFHERYQLHFEVIRNLPKREDPAHFDNNASKNSERFILYQGALNEGRGLEELITAMQSIEGITLKIAGEGDKSDALRTLVKELNLGEKVIFMGFLTPIELKKLTKDAYIGVNLLKNQGLNYYHSLANKFFDYIQWGIPSINMEFPEYIKIIDQYHCALMIKNTDPSNIIQAISALKDDVVLYKNLSENCKRAAIDLCWENEIPIFKTKLNF